MSKISRILAIILAGLLVLALFGMTACTKAADNDGGDEATPASSTQPTTLEFNLVTPGTITVGSDTTFPPMESMNGNVAEGFDVDLMNAIGKELGLKVVFKTEIFDTLIQTLKAGGKFDVIASSLTINPERSQEISFTVPYFDSNQSVAMKKGSKYSAPADLKGKKVGVQSGTTGESWAKENLKPAGATVVPFKTVTEAFAALQAGNVAAVINDLPVTADIVKDPARGLEIVQKVGTAEQYGFAVNPQNQALLKAMNGAIDSIKASGEYDAIYSKWIGSK